MLVKMTNRNKMNLAFIVVFANWTIFRLNPSHAQYAGLFLFLLFAPKAFWLTLDAIASWHVRNQPLLSQKRPSSTPETADRVES
jgi:hypothetical protein